MINKQENSIGEEVVIALLRKGNEKALEIIFRQYNIPLLFFAMKYLEDIQMAEDVVAVSFIKLWQKKSDFNSMPAIKSFLYITVKNACIDEIRISNRHRVSHKEIEFISQKTEDPYIAEHELIRAELLHKIWEDIESLPPVRRKIFKMIYLEGRNTMEIARTLQISVDTVRVQKARALHTIRALLNERL